jgi:hypothetical protein
MAPVAATDARHLLGRSQLRSWFCNALLIRARASVQITSVCAKRAQPSGLQPNATCLRYHGFVSGILAPPVRGEPKAD